jgi:lambda family phage portal protein
MVDNPKIPKARLNFIDRAVDFFNPKLGMERRKYRSMNAVADAWNGGSKAKRSGFWHASKGDADADILPELDDMRFHCRDLIRNNPLAAGAINTKVSNIVGAGIRAQIKPNAQYLGWTPEQAKAWEIHVENEWAMWNESADCDISRRLNFNAAIKLVFRSMLENGDILINLPFNATQGMVYNMRLQLIEADRLSNPNGKTDGEALKNGNAVYGGVEKDRLGAPVAYHISDQHPGANYKVKNEVWTRIQAYGKNTGRRNILHIYDPKRIDQTRGIPDLAAVIEPLKQLQRYSEAEIAAAVVSAAFTVFVKTTDAKDLDTGIDPEAREVSEYAPGGMGGSMMRPSYVDTTEREAGLAPGAMINLFPEEEVSFANPARPNPAFDPFVQAVLRQIGTALELPFEVLIKHFTASYSAARAALLEAWRYYLTMRSWLVDAACQPIYEEWLAEAVASGRVSAPGFFDDPAMRKAYTRVLWVGPGRGQINPQAETAAAIERIHNGLSTIEKEVAEMDGSDWEMLHQQSVKEKQARVTDGLELAVDAEIKSAEKLSKQQAKANSGDTSTDAKD